MKYAIVKIKEPIQENGQTTAILGFKCSSVREDFFKYAEEIESFEFVSCRRAKEAAKEMELKIHFMTKLPANKSNLL